MIEILFIVETIILLILIIYCFANDLDPLGIFLFVVLLLNTSSIIYSKIKTDLEGIPPQAIDVYRGSTELQITYQVVGNDTIPVDSIVIWKPRP